MHRFCVTAFKGTHMAYSARNAGSYLLSAVSTSTFKNMISAQPDARTQINFLPHLDLIQTSGLGSINATHGASQTGTDTFLIS